MYLKPALSANENTECKTSHEPDGEVAEEEDDEGILLYFNYMLECLLLCPAHECGSDMLYCPCPSLHPSHFG